MVKVGKAMINSYLFPVNTSAEGNFTPSCVKHRMDEFLHNALFATLPRAMFGAGFSPLLQRMQALKYAQTA
ncbi:MAG: hypothetical protein CMO02_01150 [Thalassospira sp.]|nr:hypothetical protein [Thalassospira sp.]